MGTFRLRRGLVVGLFICMGLIGLTATQAFAVAGKFTSAPEGVALSGGNLTLELEEPVDGKTEITVPVNQGKFDVPVGVDENKAKRCRYKNEKGEETGWFRCGGYLVFGSGMAATGSGGMTSGLMGGIFGTGGLEFVISGGGVTAFGGGNDGTSASSVSSSTRSGDSLAGSSLNLQLRAFPIALYGIKLGAFAEFDQFFGADATAGIDVFHPFGSNPQALDTKTTRRLKHAYAFGLTQVIPIGGGFSVDFLQGLAFIRQEIEGESDESKGGGTLIRASSSATNIVPKLGTSIEYQFPGSSVSMRIASEFIYLPSQETNAFSTFTNRPYSFSTDSTWTANAMFGLVIPLSALVGH